MTAAPEKFRTKPVEIEAMQWDGTPAGAGPIIDWVLANSIHTATYDDSGRTNAHIRLNREHGFDIVEAGDWVMQNVSEPGNFYSWPGSAFDQNYDRIVGENDYARIYTDDAGEWRYQAFAGNHRLIGSSEDGKATRQGVLRELKREYPHIQKISERREGE